MNKPKFVKIDNTILKINTDFRIAIECDKIARDTSIGDFERALAINYKLFGEDGLNYYNQDKLIQYSMKYISFGREEKSFKTHSDDKYKLDFSKCRGIISSSFKFDYNYDPYELEYLHWYDFYNDLENLSTSEFGHCCILNRIVNLFNYDTREIKDTKKRTEINKTKEQLRRKYCICEEKEITAKQKESAKEFYKLIGIDI